MDSASIFSLHFNPRSDERSDVFVTLLAVYLRIFQSTLRRTERPIPVTNMFCLRLISIHAPTNGATSGIRLTNPTKDISIHAPTNGATFLTVVLSFHRTFQSALRRTERHSYIYRLQPSALFQSTLRRTERPGVPC